MVRYSQVEVCSGKNLAMRKQKFFQQISILPMLLILLSACSPEISDDPIPFVPFATIYVNLNLPAYQSLKTSGYVYIDGGVRGILLHRLNSTTYVSYERNCSFQPNDACATVEMHVSNLYIFDACCNSSFNLSNGEPSSGPAWRPLRQYRTTLSGTDVIITDDIVN